MEKIIYITGASSEISKKLRKNLSKLSHKINIYGRSELKTYNNEKFIKYSLGDEITPLKGNYEHIIYHLAHDHYDRRRNDSNINVRGLDRIISSFKDVSSKKIIFISTPDSQNQKATTYTLQKRLCESLLNLDIDMVIRPSLIISENAMNNLFRHLPRFAVPIPYSKSRIAPIILNKFSKELLEHGLDKNSNGLILFSGKEPMFFNEFLKKYHKINTFKIYNSLWFVLIFFLRLSHVPKLFYISERILGYIYIRDIEFLMDNNIKKKYL
jgi:hypothetical protein